MSSIATLVSSGAGLTADAIEGQFKGKSGAGVAGVVVGKVAESFVHKKLGLSHANSAAVEVSVKEGVKAGIKKAFSEDSVKEDDD